MVILHIDWRKEPFHLLRFVCANMISVFSLADGIIENHSAKSPI